MLNKKFTLDESVLYHKAHLQTVYQQTAKKERTKTVNKLEHGLDSLSQDNNTTPIVNFEIQLNTLPNLRMFSCAHFLPSLISWVKAVKQEHSVSDALTKSRKKGCDKLS